ncbi:MAG: FecR domain-containing protein, partial [Pyrinomonadaceae bacterium]|nr:FecR domain-containing protein [Pyrinomonadaceae bacterium]
RHLQSWTVARLAGAPKVASNNIEESGRWTTGEWLETDGVSRARIDVANIGRVEVAPNSRLRLVETNESEHRLALVRGKIQASISAPPRLFFVDTPSAVAVDYGCAYTLEVDEHGRSFLHVTAGWVALEAQGRESFVPAGAMCASEPGKAPGTPYFSDAQDKFRHALIELDFGNNESSRRAALDTVINEARKRDALTLWHLLARVSDVERVRVYKRLAVLVPPPEDITREGVLNLDKEMLRLWKEKLEQVWNEDAV